MNFYEGFCIVRVHSKIKMLSSGLFGQDMMVECNRKIQVLLAYIVYMKVLLYSYNDDRLTTKAFVLYF